MTEAEWLTTTDPISMLDCVPIAASTRKLRLTACACVRRIWHLFILRKHEPSRRAVELAEAVADGKVSELRLPPAWEAARMVDSPFQVHHTYAAALTTCRMPDNLQAVMSHAASATDNATSEKIVQCGILRDVFGNPFHSDIVDPRWLTDTVVALAEGIYADHAFDRMPILADALQDAGCEVEAILTHCRDESLTHVRGCWVADLVLGKS